MKSTNPSQMLYPIPGARCGFKIGKHAVNGSVEKVEITRKQVWITIRVSKVWGTRKRLYRVSVNRLHEWYSF